MADYPIVEIPNEILKVDNLLPMYLRENFEAFHLALSKLQVYLNETGIRGGKMNSSLVEIIDEKGLTKFLGDGLRIYNTDGALQGHFGYYETLSDLLATFTRASTAYDSYGTSYASGVERYEYAPLPAPVWQDLFDADKLSQYTSGGAVAGTWAVSGGVLTGTGGTQATLVKKDLLLQDCDIVINSDQAQDGGIIARYQDVNNYYLLALSDDSGSSPASNLNLYKRVGGTLTNLATADVTWARGVSKPIKFTPRGSRLEAYFDGVKVISKTDTTFSGGSVGLRNNNATAFRVLDFSVYYASQGVEMEEGTTNLILNASFEAGAGTVADGWSSSTAATLTATYSLDTTEHRGSSLKSQKIAVTASTGAGNAEVNQMVNVSPSTKYTFSPYLKGVRTGTGYAYLCVDWYDSSSVYISRTLALNGAPPADWTRYPVSATSPATAAKANVRLIASAAAAGDTITLYFDDIQLEAKGYATSVIYASDAVTQAARNADSLYSTFASVLPSEWFVSGFWKPDNPNTIDRAIDLVLCTLRYDDSNRFILYFSTADDKLNLLKTYGGTGVTLSSGAVTFLAGDTIAFAAAQLTQAYGDLAAGMHLWYKIGSAAVVHVSNTNTGIPTAPTKLYAGCREVAGSEADGVIGNIKVVGVAASLETINNAWAQAYLTSGTPAVVDGATTLLMTLGGTLKPTVRRFGLWSKNGEITLDNPPVHGGIRVYDASGNLRTHIGQYATGKYGAKVINGEVYSTLFRTGAETDLTYIALVPPNLLQVWSNVGGVAKLQLEIAAAISGGGGGGVDFYVDDTLTGQTSAIANNLRISSATSAVQLSLIGPANSIILKTNNGIDYTAGSNYHMFYSDIVQATGTKRNVEDTVDFGRRLLSVIESPEQIYTDIKKGRLDNGICKILLDPIFLQCIEPDTEDTPWLIHLTPYADVSIFVAEIGTDYFIVKERNGGTSNSTFVWSLFATRKNHAYERFLEVV